MLLGAQGKLAPKKFVTRLREEQLRAAPSVTLPRLELTAAEMAERLTDKLLLLMPKETPVAFYTDSDITLKRIQGDPNMSRLRCGGSKSSASGRMSLSGTTSPQNRTWQTCSQKTAPLEPGSKTSCGGKVQKPRLLR